MQQPKLNKTEQLGMNFSTASNRLVKDLLFDFVVKAGHSCFRCGLPLTRNTFSIEHVVPWLHSDDPTELFFDLDNTSFSHLKCNVDSRRPYTVTHETTNRDIKGCKCRVCLDFRAEEKRTKHYTKEKRRAQYLRTGK